MFFAEERSPIVLGQQTEAGVNETPNQHVILVHPACDTSRMNGDPIEIVVSPPETVDAEPLADDGLPEALEEKEGGGGVRDLEEDVCEFCGQGLLDERFVGHPVTFFQRTISFLAGGREVTKGRDAQ